MDRDESASASTENGPIASPTGTATKYWVAGRWGDGGPVEGPYELLYLWPAPLGATAKLLLLDPNGGPVLVDGERCFLSRVAALQRCAEAKFRSASTLMAEVAELMAKAERLSENAD